MFPARNIMNSSYSASTIIDLFKTAVTFMDSGNNTALATLLQEHPALVTLAMPQEENAPLNYFSGAFLLHYVAGNPNRGNLPKSIVDSAQLLLDAGADPNVKTLTGSTPIGLVLSSKDASQSGVGLALIELLVKAGATDDLDNEDVLLMPLCNCAPETALQLWQHGYPVGVRAAAGLRQIALVRELLQAQPPQNELDEALTYAVIHHHHEIILLLLEHGANINAIPPVYGNPGTALHIASDLETARLLTENGADLFAVDPTFNGTPLDWATHGGHTEIVDYLRSCMTNLRTNQESANP